MSLQAWFLVHFKHGFWSGLRKRAPSKALVGLPDIEAQAHPQQNGVHFSEPLPVPPRHREVLLIQPRRVLNGKEWGRDGGGYATTLSLRGEKTALQKVHKTGHAWGSLVS